MWNEFFSMSMPITAIEMPRFWDIALRSHFKASL